MDAEAKERQSGKDSAALGRGLGSASKGTNICELFIELKVNVKVMSLSHVRLLATPWTVAYQAPPSMGFSRQEYWSGLPFPSPEDFLTQGSNPGLPHCRHRRFTV